MARIDGVADADAGLATKQIFRAASRMRGDVPDPLRLMAHSKPVMWAAGLFETARGRAKSVDPVLKAVCQLKVSALVGCVF